MGGIIGYDTESCKSALEDLDEERTIVLSSFNEHQNLWENFSQRLEKKSSNNLSTWMKSCFVLAFIFSLISGPLGLKQE